MKVRQIISALVRNYDLDADVMAFWVGSEFKETQAGTWEKAVEIWDNEDVIAVFQDYLSDLITDAEIQIEKEQERAELGIDTYLHDLAEKELESENV